MNKMVSAMETFPAETYQTLSVSGMGTCSGNALKADHIDISGMLNCTDAQTIEANRLDCTGNCNTQANLSVKNVNVRGLLRCGNLTAYQLDLTGVVYGQHGKIHDLDVSGLLELKGVLTAERAEITGKASAQSLEGKQLEVDGELKAAGDLTIREKLNVNGSISAANVQTGQAKIDGQVKLTGLLRSGIAEINGVLHSKNVECDRFIGDGVVNTAEQLSADLIEYYGIIRAKEVVGDQIHIDSKNRQAERHILFRKSVSKKEPYSTADLIEATRVELYQVHAKQVNGADVTIGDGCIVDQVDCSGTLRIAPGAKIGKYTAQTVIQA